MSKRQKYSDAVVPRRPRNAYNIFFAAERERLMHEAQNEGGVDAVSTLAAATAEPTSKKKRNQACFANMARSMSHRWKTLNATEKQKYFALAQEEQQKYHAAMNACFNATEEEDDKKVAATASAAAATNASSSLVPPPSVPLDGGSWTSLLSTVNSPRHLPKNEKKITDPADLFQRKKPPPPLVDLSPKTSTLLEDRMLWLNRGDQQLQAGGGGFLPTQFQPLSVQETHKQQDRHFEDRSEEESKMNSSYRLPLLATDAAPSTSANSTSGSRMDLRQAARMASAAAVLASSSASMSVQHPSSDLPHSAHTSSEASSLPHASEFGWANTKKETAVAPSQHDQSRVATMSQDSAATLLHLSQQFLESSTTNLHEDLAGHDQEYQKHLLLPPPPAHQQQAPPSSSLSFPQDHDFVSRNEEVCWRNDLDVFTPTIHNARSSKGAPSSRSTGFGATPADLAVSLGSEAVEFLIDTFRSGEEESCSNDLGGSGRPVLLSQTAVQGRQEEEDTAASRITYQHDRTSLWDF
uniref:HMG box domain-containing protein n=1 Tax=Entomoneis paludosa TaxID=265537 RepID=A0A7S2YMZ9_9STRA|mmetsp:Transcript_39365/g.81733  ORF Transcript_39365/g.81733 Transcript_39365/m.81733 type:complete len:523 (+) Transcript_39365:285-1853(+)